jgi:FAD/FMN-containing dehydrogenase
VSVKRVSLSSLPPSTEDGYEDLSSIATNNLRTTQGLVVLLIVGDRTVLYRHQDMYNAERITEWIKEYWAALHPYSAGGAYVNFMMDEGQERIKATYGDNFERLVAIKNEYDPTNLFRVNQNIKPTATV